MRNFNDQKHGIRGRLWEQSCMTKNETKVKFSHWTYGFVVDNSDFA